MLGQEDRDLAVGLAVSRARAEARAAGVRGRPGVARGRPRRRFGCPDARRCAPSRAAPGCYRAAVAAQAPRTVQVAIRGQNRPASTLAFPLPASVTGAPATALVRRAEKTWRRCGASSSTTGSRPGRATRSPRSGASRPRPQRLRDPQRPAGRRDRVRRWDRLPGHGWQESQQDPLPQPIPLWQAVSNARFLGTPTLRGRPVWGAFFDPQIHAWFTIVVDRETMHTLELRMTARPTSCTRSTARSTGPCGSSPRRRHLRRRLHEAARRAARLAARNLRARAGGARRRRPGERLPAHLAALLPLLLEHPEARPEKLKPTVADANKRGYRIRVAVITSPYDLGSVSALWEQAEGLRRVPRRARLRLSRPDC